MSDLPLNDPGAWEVYRTGTPLPELRGVLRGRTDPLGRARYAEVLALSRDTALLQEAAQILIDDTLPLWPGLHVQALGLLRLWHESLAFVRAYTLPPYPGPLDFETGSAVYLYGGMAALSLGHELEAAEYRGAAGMLAGLAGMGNRVVALRVESLRAGNLSGVSNVDGLRRAVGDAQGERLHTHAVHVLCEALCGRGQYREALEALQGMTDPRSVGMQAYFSAMLRLPWNDPGGRDDWLRLARAVTGYARGMIDVAELDMVHEPQATYARLFVAADALSGPEPVRAVRVSRDTPPAPHDQRALWAFIRAAAVGRGAVVPGAGVPAAADGPGH